MSEDLPREISWMGSIPDDYTITRLGRVVEHVKKKNKGHLSQNLLSLSYGEIKQKDIDTSEGLLPESFETYNLIEKDDIVLRLTDLQNDKRSLRSAISTQDGIITSAYITIRPAKIYPKFLAYYLRSLDTAKVFYSLGSGLRQSLTWDDVKLIPVVVPPLDKQKRIVDQLDRELAEIDNLLKDFRKLNSHFEEKFNSQVDDILQNRKPSAVHQKLSWHATFHNGDRGSSYPSRDEFTSTGIPFINAGHLEGSSINYTLMNYITEEKYLSLGGAKLTKGDVLFCLRGSVGKSALFEGISGALASSLVAIRPASSLDSHFLLYVLKSSKITTEISNYISGSAQPNLSVEDLQRIQIPLPSLETQKMIVSEIEEIYNDYQEIVLEFMHSINLLDSRKLSLIQEYLIQ